MHRRYLLSLIVISMAWAGCQTPPAPTPVASTAPPSASPMPRGETPTPSAAPTDSALTAAPSATPTAVPDEVDHLRSAGPYLLAAPRSTEPMSLVYLDGNGHGAARVALPEGYRLEGALRHGLSPEERYLVLYAGTAAEAPYDLRLGLYDLDRGTLAQEIALLSPDYPEDLRHLFRDRIAPGSGFDPAYADDFQDTIGRGYLSLWDWSPNGRYLAFAGQMDGPSTDVYLLDVQTGQVRRMTDGLEQVVSLAWSPDGRRILNGSSNDFGEGMLIHFWSADVAADTNVALGDASAGEAKWVSDLQVFIHGQTNGRFSNIDAQLVNAVTGDVRSIWSAYYEGLTLDLDAGTADLMGCPYDVASDAECGRFTVNLTTGVTTRVGDLDAPEAYPTHEVGLSTFRDLDDNRLLIRPERLEIETATGEIIVPLGDRAAWQGTSSFVLSRDHAYAFLCDSETDVGWHVVEVTTGQVHSLNTILTRDTTLADLAWVTDVPDAFRPPTGSVTITPEAAAPRVSLLLGKRDGWSIEEPLQVFDSRDQLTRVNPLPNASHASWTWSTRLSPRHDYLLYDPDDRGDVPDPDVLAATDYQLWIQDVRTGVFVQRIDLLSPAALEVIATSDLAIAGEISTAPVMGVARAAGEHLAWSPDGRYLAFTAASHGPTADLYVFDTETLSTRRLTHESMSLGLIFWSPDSRRVVARELLDYEPYPDGNCDFCTPGRTLVVSVADGAIARLDGPLGIHLAGWSSAESFLTFAAPFEAPLMYLSEADLVSAEIHEVFPGAFADVAIATTTGDIWLSYFTSDPFRHFTTADGLYRLNRESGALEPWALGAEWAGGLTYLREWDALAVWSAGPSRSLRVLNADGTERFRLTGLEPQARLEDNRSWLLVQSTTRGWVIVDAQGQEVAAPGPGCVRWLPGNEGVLSVSAGSTRLLRASHHWQPEPVDVPADLCDSGRVIAVEDR